MTDPAALADLIARHAVALLLVVSVLGLVTARLVWHAIERYAPALLPVGARWWRRVDPRGLVARLLGLEGAIAFLVAVAATFAFVEIADAVDEDEELTHFDVALAAALGRRLSPDALAFFARITHLGDFEVITALATALGLVLLLRRDWLIALGLVLASAGAGAMNEVLKGIFERARPQFVHALVHVEGYSFPSGHSAGSFAFYGFAAYVAVRRLPRAWHLPLAGAALLLIVFVGASRVMLQVHFLSDVLAGWLGAATWTALCITALESLRSRAARSSERRS